LSDRPNSCRICQTANGMGASTDLPVAAPPASGDTLFRSLRQPAVPESVALQVRRHILGRGLAPGDRLPSEAELAGELGANRLSVREGLRGLEALGLVEVRVGSGWYVRRFDVSTASDTFAWSLAFHPTALLDLLAVRRATEADIVEELAGRLTPHELAVLDELVDRMRWKASRGRMPIQEDRDFHTRLFAASGNQVALALTDFSFRLLAALYRHGFPGPVAEELPEVAETHADLLEALRRGDRETARRVLRWSHHAEAQQRFTAWVDEQRKSAPDGGASLIRSAVQVALLGPADEAGAPAGAEP
jgi:DNA-binding FadR family transcriptional regulator